MCDEMSLVCTQNAPPCGLFTCRYCESMYDDYDDYEDDDMDMDPRSFDDRYHPFPVVHKNPSHPKHVSVAQQRERGGYVSGPQRMDRVITQGEEGRRARRADGNKVEKFAERRLARRLRHEVCKHENVD